jgi:hypothetical protein
MNSVKDMIKDGKKVRFIQYKHNQLWYETECGFRFPVDTSDTGDGTFLAEDKAILFMRYINKAVNAEKEDAGQLNKDQCNKAYAELLVGEARTCKCPCHESGTNILHCAPCC